MLGSCTSLLLVLSTAARCPSNGIRGGNATTVWHMSCNIFVDHSLPTVAKTVHRIAPLAVILCIT